MIDGIHKGPLMKSSTILSVRTSHRRQVRLAVSAVCLAALLAGGLTLPQAAQAQAVTNSSLYYRLGGGSPFGGTLNKSQLALRLGVTLRLNYSCGKFDIGLSWTNLMNNLKQLGSEITSAVQAGIAALPMYIFQRAMPGLYQLFQTYSAKADLLNAAALKNCEQMEAEIKRGGDPYADFAEAAKDLQWKYEADAGNTTLAKGGGDIIAAQTAIEQDEAGQRAGWPWVFGANAGGVGQSPIKPIHDLTIAGYQVTCNTQPTNVGTGSSICPSDSRIAQAFGTADAMADWSTKVLGDHEIYTCSQADSDCPQPSAGTTATGLNARLQDEINTITPILQDVYSNPADNAQLAQIATPGFAISPQLMESIRRMPTDEQPLVMGRLINEMAMHRTVDKALLVRNVLLTGLSIPQAASTPTKVQQQLQAQIDRLTHYIDDLLYEWRIRKEITGETAMTVMRESMFQDSLGTLQRQGLPDDKQPLMNGAVQNSTSP